MGQDFAKNYLVMLSVSYAGKTEYSAGIFDALLRVDTSGTNTCYVLVQCGVLTSFKIFRGGIDGSMIF